MRSLNVRLLAIIVGAGVVFAVAAFALNRFQIYRHASFFYEKAQETKDSDDFEQQLEAVKNLQRYLNFCPDDDDVRAEMGELVVDIADKGGLELRRLYGNAFATFEHVLRNDYTRSDVRRNLVEVAITTNRFSDAKEHIEVLLKESPDDAELLTWMGQCQASLDKDEKAIELFKKAVEIAPEKTEAYIQLATLLRKGITLDAQRDLHPTVNVPVTSVAESQSDAIFPTGKEPAAIDAAGDKPIAKSPTAEEPEKINVEGDKPASQNPQATVPAVADTGVDKQTRKKPAVVATIEQEDENHPDTWMNRLVEANPQSSRAHLIRGEYLQRTDKPDEAHQEAVETLKCMPQAVTSLDGCLRKISKALDDLAASLPAAPASAEQAVEELKAVTLQLQNVAQDATSLAENKDCPAIEDALKNPLNKTADVLQAVNKSLSDITIQNKHNDDVAASLSIAAAAKAEAEENYASLEESLEGALLLLAECEAKKAETDNARRFALRALKFFPRSASVYAILSQLDAISGNAQEARRWIDHGLDATDDSPILLWRKANFLIDDLTQDDIGAEEKTSILDKLAHLKDQLQKSMSFYRLPPFITYLSARTAFVQGRWAEASKLCDAIHNDLARMAPHLAVRCDQMSALCYARLNRPELARAAATRSRREAAAPVSRLVGIVRLITRGKMDEAIVEMDKMIEAGEVNEDAWVVLAQNNLAINHSRKKSKQDWDVFNQIFQQAKKSNPDDLRLVAIAVDALAAQDKYDEAIILLEEACQNNPKEPKFWRFLIRMAQQKEDWKLAEKTLLEAEKQFGDSADLRISRAIFLVSRDGKEACDALQKLSQNTDNFTDTEKAQLWHVLSACARKAADLDLAKQFGRKAAQSNPTNLQLQISLFEIAAKKKDAATMAEAVKQNKKIETDGPMWHYYEAVRLATSDNEKDQKEKNLDAALEHLNQAKIFHPNWDRIYLLAGRIHFHKGDEEAAVDSLIDAVSKGSRDSRGIGLLVSLLYNQGRAEEAQRYIGLLEDQQGELSTQTKRLQAHDLLARGELEEGLQHFRQITENSDNFRDYLQLGQILAVFYQKALLREQTDNAKKIFEEAEQALQKAVQMAPEEPSTWLALVQLFHRAENDARAFQIIDEAKQTVPQEHLPLVLALCYQHLGRDTDAEQQFRRAASASDGKDRAGRYLASFYLRKNKIPETEQTLTKIINRKQAASENDIAWARRRKAILLYEKGGLPNRRDAIALLDENLKSNPESILDMREKARMLATFNNTKDRKEARILLEKLLSRPNPNADDRFIMANILLAENNWPGVTRQMRQLLAAENVKPIWLRFYVNALLNRNELGDASSYLKRLERLEPGSDAVTKFNIVILSRRGNYDKIVEILDNYVENPPKKELALLKPKEIEQVKTARTINAAQSLEGIIDTLPTTETGNDPKKIAATKLLTDKAEKYWRKIADLHPEGTLRLVRFLGEHGKRDEALSLAENTWQKGHPASVASTLVSLIGTGEATPQQMQRVERMLNDAIISFGENNALILAMAELRNIQRRYEEAETLYRKVLDKYPRNVVALNNLAVFLALRDMKKDEALQMINRAITVAGPRPTLLDSRSSVHLSRGEWQKSLDDLAIAISSQATATRFFHKAQALLAGEQEAEAKQAFDRAHELGLNVNKLQPLERPAYRQLRETLK